MLRCFAMFALFPKFGARTRTQDLWPFLISETGLKFLIWTQGKIHLGNRASPVNRAHMKRPSIGSHRSMRVMTSFMATTTLRRSAILCKDYGTEDWQQSLWLACYVSLWYMIHFGGHLTLSAQRGQEFHSHGNYSRPIASHTNIYLFNIQLKKEMMRLLYNVEHWILKLQIWLRFITSHSRFALASTMLQYYIKVECCALNFQEQVIKFKLNLKVGCYNLMLAAQVECWGLKLIFGGDWKP